MNNPCEGVPRIRLARVVAPDIPHHVTQPGNRRLKAFFEDDGCRAYLRLLAASCAEAGVAAWAPSALSNACRDASDDRYCPGCPGLSRRKRIEVEGVIPRSSDNNPFDRSYASGSRTRKVSVSSFAIEALLCAWACISVHCAISKWSSRILAVPSGCRTHNSLVITPWALFIAQSAETRAAVSDWSTTVVTVLR